VGQALLYVIAENTQVQHDQVGVLEHVRVDTLQDKMGVRRSLQRSQVGVVEVAFAVGTHVNDPSTGTELCRSYVAVAHALASSP
jgi:hypothetical protein